MGSDKGKFGGTSWACMFQPTLPHGERLRFQFCCSLGLSVSTHAPAWGATFHIMKQKSFLYVSTHAPAWGATGKQTGLVLMFLVSTHAPAWGATISKA